MNTLVNRIDKNSKNSKKSSHPSSASPGAATSAAKSGAGVQLPVGQLLHRANAWFQTGLLNHLHQGVLAGVNLADLNLLAHLNCGTTYCSELARRLGVSRQAINRLLANLVKQRLVTLKTDADRRNQKVIVITAEGEEAIRTALEELERMEKELARRIGSSKAKALRDALTCDWGPPPGGVE